MFNAVSQIEPNNLIKNIAAKTVRNESFYLRDVLEAFAFYSCLKSPVAYQRLNEAINLLVYNVCVKETNALNSRPFNLQNAENSL
jgi:hypothetical protein